ncbi:TetR/AcrR family transcriptional regulator [Mycobacterium sp. KBS0706]|uniref:helix-turn-helix domain-containing protein n=1 Tax=Mycobacterium sp. KBS0706 TaxID=2578109 RepID=UPI00110FDB2B|nr:helix-turn-helix domain-containing protein [Mycobacterium sp. KBS0706]TSD88504.1 TetR/AcrR family transcriptional regulator [Mycobacterium sp. KBS0706]
MPRPRTVPDEALLDGALAVMRRAGPEGLTFAAVAAETGLSAATLVQRFGGKAALVQAALLRAWDLLDARTAAADAAAPPTPAGAVDLLVALSGDYGDDYAEGLLVLREDLRDPVLRRRGAAWGRVLATALGRRLADSAGPRPDLGRLMAAQWQGAVLWWGFERGRSLPEAVAAELEAWCRAIGAPTGSGQAG